MITITRTFVLLGMMSLFVAGCKHSVTGPNASTIKVNVAATPSPAQIAAIPLNETATATITLHNNSKTRRAQFISVSLSGVDVAAFGVDSIASLPQQIDSGGSISFTIKYSPVKLGPVYAIVTMHLTSDTATATIVDTVSASATAPKSGTLCTSVNAIDFGSVRPAAKQGASNGFSQTVWISNCDSIPVTLYFDPRGINTVSVQLSDTAFKAVLPRIDRILNPRDSMSIAVSFAPGVPGNYAGVMTIACPTAPHPINISLTGICDNHGWPRGAAPDTVDFGTIPLATLRDTSFHVHNPFNVAVLMTGLSELSKMDIVIPAHDFDKNPQLILAHDSLRVAIQVRPPAIGPFYDPLTIQFREVASGTVVITGSGE